MIENPNVILRNSSGTEIGTPANPVHTDGSGVTQPVSGPLTDAQLRAAAVPVTVAGVATAANQSTGNASLSSIDSKLTGAATAANQATGNAALNTINASVTDVTNTVWAASDEIKALVNQLQAPIDPGNTVATHSNLMGAQYRATQPTFGDGDQAQLQCDANGNLRTVIASAVDVSGSDISIVSSAIPAGAATEAKQDALNARLPAVLGQQAAAASLGVTLANENLTDLSQSSPATLQAINSNVLNTAANISTPLDLDRYRSIAMQFVTSAGVTASPIVFEGSNNGVSFVACPLYDKAAPATAPASTFTLAASSNRFFYGPCEFRYFRARNTSAIVAGTLTAHTVARMSPFTNQQAHVVASGTVAVTGSLTSAGTVSSVASAALAAGLVTDQASAAITTTTTSAAVVTTNLQAASFSVIATVVTGTNPTLDVVLQESNDNVNWFDSYHFERLTAPGVVRSPLILLQGSHTRYVQTVGGTAPSFTRSIVRNTRATASVLVRRFFNRTINVNLLDSTTPAFSTLGAAEFQLTLTLAAGGTPPAIQLQGSQDGVNWYNFGSPVTGVTGSTVFTVGAALCKFVRGIITTAGTGATLTYVEISGRE